MNHGRIPSLLSWRDLPERLRHARFFVGLVLLITGFAVSFNARHERRSERRAPQQSISYEDQQQARQQSRAEYRSRKRFALMLLVPGFILLVWDGIATRWRGATEFTDPWTPSRKR